MKCPNCGHENVEGSVYCSKCATKLEAPVLCPKCGNENLPDAIFCQKCAARIIPAEYCRFCGGEISTITGRCGQCNKDRNGETPKFSQAVSAAKQGAAQVFSGIDRTWIEPGLILLAAAIMVICLLSTWVDANISSSLMNIFGENNVPNGISILNIVKLYESAIAGTEGKAFIIVPYILIGLSIVAIIYLGIMAKQIFSGNAEAKTYGYSHFKNACIAILSVIIILMISIFVMQAQLNEIMEAQWGYSGAGLRLEMTAAVYWGLVLSLGSIIYVSRKYGSVDKDHEVNAFGNTKMPSEAFHTEGCSRETEENVCWSCGSSLLEGSAFCASCGVDQNALKGQNAGSEFTSR